MANQEPWKVFVMKYILGIDPGIHGAICFYNPEHIEIFDMPTHTITINSKKKTRLDVVELARMVDHWAKDIERAIIEEVGASPQMGVTSSFAFGQSFGIVQGIVAASFIPTSFVRPQKWKKHFGLSQDKDASRRKASELFPQYAEKWSRAKDDGRAEALLIAIWGGLNG